SGFVQYHPRVLAWERDLWKSEGIQNQIRTVREFELLPDNRIKGDIGSKIEDRHVLHEPSLGELNGSAFPFILREAQQLDSGVRFCFVVGDWLEVFLFDESNNRVRVLGRIERCTGGRRLSSRHRREQESEKKQHNWKHRYHYNRWSRRHVASRRAATPCRQCAGCGHDTVRTVYTNGAAAYRVARGIEGPPRNVRHSSGTRNHSRRRLGVQGIGRRKFAQTVRFR